MQIWGILWRPFKIRLFNRPKIIGCCINLSNYCIEVILELKGELRELEGIFEVNAGVCTWFYN